MDNHEEKGKGWHSRVAVLIHGFLTVCRVHTLGNTGLWQKPGHPSYESTVSKRKLCVWWEACRLEKFVLRGLGQCRVFPNSL